ncbi:MAG: choice-of-anchor L domain-containing protein [Bacteroidota bacterium]
MMKNKILVLSYIFLFASIFPLNAQVSVDTTMTIEDLVNDVLLGEGMTATNITYNGQPAAGLVNPAIGTFTVENSAFPIADGVVMATGPAVQISNENPWMPGFSGAQDDPDLVSITGFNMNDCAILEFDFVASTDTFLIDYIFSSIEYPGFTCSIFNDAFGIFLSGPGIDGPFTNGAENFALIPNTDIPVAINTVNSGVSSSFEELECLNANPNYVEDAIYFFNNEPQLENSISHPGHTHMFTAFAQLQVGETYHFKFAIGDASDSALDSGVMMRKGSAGSGVDYSGITIDVNTEGIDVEADGIFIAGTFNFFQPEPMTQVSENVYRYTTNQPAFVNLTYKFFNGEGSNAAELVPENCSVNGLMPDGSRHIVTTGEAMVLDPVCFGTCDICNEILSTEEKVQERLKVFPNPSQGRLQILAPNDGFARIQVFNILGSVVYDERVFLTAGTNFEFELEERGLYKVNLSFDDEGYSSTVIVE